MKKALGFLAILLSTTFFTVFSQYIYAAPSISIVFVLDESGSISASNFALETQGFQEALNSLPLDSSIEVSVIGFSSSSSIIVDKNELTAANLPVIEQALSENLKAGGGTNMSSAISDSTSLLLESSAPSKVICLATDGDPNSQSSTTLAADEAKNSGIFLSPVGIGLDSVGKSFLDSIASDPPIPNPENFTDFATVVTNICAGVTSSALNLELTPNNVDFGVTQGSGQTDCSQSETVQLQNRSNQIAQITRIAIEGEDADNFSLANAFDLLAAELSFPVNMPGLGNSELEIVLNPISTPDDGQYDASLLVSAVDENGVSGDFIATLKAPLATSCITVAVTDAQSLVKFIDENGTAFTAPDGEAISETMVQGVKPETSFQRSGLVADGNSRLFISANTSQTSGNVLFRISDASKTESSLSLLDGSSNDASGFSVIVPIEDLGAGIGQASAILRAGERFLGAAREAEVRYAVEVCILDENDVCTTSVQSKLLRERRAPVVLVHGLWAGPQSFQEQNNILLPDSPGLFQSLIGGSDNLRDVGAVVYNNAIGPTGTMGRSSKLLSRKINELCSKSIENRKLACTKADLIGHSMGGLVSRKFIQDNANYKNPRNFNQGSVRRLMTLGTPHFGSGLASLLMSDDSQLNNCIRVERNVVSDKGPSSPLVNSNGDIEADAIRALNAGEDITQNELDQGLEVLASGYTFIETAIRALNASGRKVNRSRFGAINYLAYLSSSGLTDLNSSRQSIPTMGLVGNIGDSLVFDGLGGAAIAMAIQYTGCTADDLFAGEDSDGVVSLSSAVGNLDPAHTAEFNGVQHSGMGQNQIAIDWVLQVIDSPLSNFSDVVDANAPSSERIAFSPSDKSHNHNPQPAQHNSMYEAFLNKAGVFMKTAVLTVFGINTAHAQTDQGLAISIDNASPAAGDEITISLDAPQEGLLAVSLHSKDESLTDDAAPYLWTIQLPSTASGNFSFYVSAVLGSELIRSNEISFNITLEESDIRSIIFEPSDRIVLFSGSSETLRVTGQGVDGFNRDLSGDAAGTLYSENTVNGVNVSAGDSPVFSVNASGIILAEQPGEAEVVASFGSHSATRRILVVSAEADDADGDGIKDAQEQAIGTNPFHPDSDGNGISDGVEVGANPETPLDSDGDGIIDALDTDTLVVQDENGQRISIQTSSGSLRDIYNLPLSNFPDRTGALSAIAMERGVTGFSIEDLSAGESVEVTLTFDSLPADTNSYLKYGPASPGAANSEWYEYSNFSINGNTIVLTLTDNAPGDSDPVEGVISDPGGPGFDLAKVPPATPSPSGGGCSYIPNKPVTIDPTLPLSVILALMYLLRRKLKWKQE